MISEKLREAFRQFFICACDDVLEKIEQLVSDEDMLDKMEYDRRVAEVMTLEKLLESMWKAFEVTREEGEGEERKQLAHESNMGWD